MVPKTTVVLPREVYQNSWASKHDARLEEPEPQEIVLIAFEDVPERFADLADTPEKRAEWLYRDFLTGMSYHKPPFTPRDVVFVNVVDYGDEYDGYGDQSWEWKAIVLDREAGTVSLWDIDGSHDYTGWDCQSWMDYKQVPTVEEWGANEEKGK